MTPRITHCLCTGRSFAELLEQARRDGSDIDALMAVDRRCGRRCGLCRPYLRQALRTGRTVFHEVLMDADRA